MRFDTNLIDIQGLKSNSQIIRVLSEDWYLKNGFCIVCLHSLKQFSNNSPVADFYCSACKEEFELKAKKGNIGNKINDGAYETMVQRVNSNQNPHLICMNYFENFEIARACRQLNK